MLLTNSLSGSPGIAQGVVMASPSTCKISETRFRIVCIFPGVVYEIVVAFLLSALSINMPCTLAQGVAFKKKVKSNPRHIQIKSNAKKLHWKALL